MNISEIKIEVKLSKHWFFYPCLWGCYALAFLKAVDSDKLAGFMVNRCIKWGFPK